MRQIQGDTHAQRLINLAGALAEESINTLTLTPTPPSTLSPLTLAARTCNLADELLKLGPCTLTGSGPISLAMATIDHTSISLTITPKA